MKSMKLERMKRTDKKKFIVYPEDKHKGYWDVWITIILLITCIIIPVRLAFLNFQESKQTAKIW